MKRTEIANIIFVSNKARSIHAVYDGATVKCKTSSYLKFAVRLLLPAQNAEYVMVDVRRVSGCAMAFREEYQALQAVLDINTPSSFQQTSLPDFDIKEENMETDDNEKIKSRLRQRMFLKRSMTLKQHLI